MIQSKLAVQTSCVKGYILKTICMNPYEIKVKLTRLGVRPNKRLGQHFLIDRTALRAIVEAADVHPNDIILEVGPGLGVLTKALLDKGARVTAIEQDRTFASYCEETFPDNFTVIHGDAATIHWHDIVGDAPWKFVSNLPYSITSLALRKALWAPRPADRVVVLVQREVAERAVARAGKTSLLSLMVALASRSARIVRRVPAGAFYPPSKVESAVLEIIPMTLADRTKQWRVDPEKIMEIAKRGFVHPRKLLASNLGFRDLASVGLNPKARAEDLSPQDWVRLTIRIKSNAGQERIS